MESAAYLVHELLTPELVLLSDEIMSFGTVVAEQSDSVESPDESYLGERYEEAVTRFQSEFGVPDRYYEDSFPEVMW